jgi:cytochrome c-type biogenesis protein CcsB
MNEILELKTVALFIELRLFLVVSFLYLTAVILYLFQLFAKDEYTGRLGTSAVALATVIHTFIIIFRWWEASRPPFQTLFESLSWFAWCSSATFLFLMSKKPRIHLAGLPVSLLAAWAMFFALLSRDPAPPPLAPPLQSSWFLWHVIIAFMSYAVFVVACSVELVYLYIRNRSHIIGLTAEDVERFHTMAFTLVAVGFPLLTFGIVSGAAWANDAWGRFWSWDPKETWSLITWTVFAAYLHVMKIPRWRDKYGPYVNILGFFCMIITFIGINWISKLLGIPSMHIYSV